MFLQLNYSKLMIACFVYSDCQKSRSNSPFMYFAIGQGLRGIYNSRCYARPVYWSKKKYGKVQGMK